jgi:DNA-binding CsgD family transcriptional regulator
VRDDWFVGRGKELDLLRGLLAGVVAGVGGSVLIEGEQGIGKTTLLRHALLKAEDECQVAWATADELGRHIPLGLMADGLGLEGRRAVAGESGDLGGAAGSALAGDPVLAGAERILALVDRLCADRPLIFVAEDLQWADEMSVLVWQRLSRAALQVPLLVVGSLRPAPIRDDLAQLRGGVAARGGQVVTLEPLASAEVTDLVGRVIGGRPGRGLARLAERAGGNPLYARELADALIRGERVEVSAGVAELTGSAAEVRVPVSLAGVIRARLASLGEDALAVFRWAAVLGQEFSVTDLEVVTGRDASDLIEVVQEATAAGVVAEAGQRLRFRHGLIRQVLYEGMPAALRSALHLQAARALAEASAAPERVAAQLAAVPDISEGWVWDWLAKTAGGLAYRAPQVTADLLRTALAQLLPGDSRREALEAVLVHVAFLLLEDDQVERVGRRLLASTRDPDRAADIAWLVGYTLMRTVRPADGAEVIKQALNRPGTSTAHVARLRALHAMTLTGTDRIEEGVQEARAALASAQAIGDRFAAGYALQTLMWQSYHAQDFAGVLDRIDEALAAIGDDPETIDLHLLLMMNRFAMLDAMDRRAEALATAQQALALGERAGTPRLAEIRSNLAAVYFQAGQWDDAVAQLEVAVTSPGPTLHMVVAHGMYALIAGHRDDSAALEEHLAAIDNIPVRYIAWGKPVSDVFLARALAAERAGNLEQAEAILAECLEADLSEVMVDVGSVLPTLCRLALTAGHDATAARAYALARANTDTEVTYCRGLVEADPAEVMAVAAAHRSADRPLLCAVALEDAAVLLAQRGETHQAQAAFTEAVDLYEAMGADWDVRRAVERLRPHGIRRGTRPSRRPDSGWAALTPTEVKIAYLVAQGQSNPDVAAELSISRNTVQTHVSHILAKLGARSRAEIAREVYSRPRGTPRASTG